MHAELHPTILLASHKADLTLDQAREPVAFLAPGSGDELLAW
jgi:hypothetical protein